MSLYRSGKFWFWWIINKSSSHHFNLWTGPYINNTIVRRSEIHQSWLVESFSWTWWHWNGIKYEMKSNLYSFKSRYGIPKSKFTFSNVSITVSFWWHFLNKTLMDYSTYCTHTLSIVSMRTWHSCSDLHAPQQTLNIIHNPIWLTNNFLNPFYYNLFSIYFYIYVFQVN